MTAVTNTTSAAASAASSSASNNPGGLTSQDFIKLMVAELKDQNPSSPTNPQDLANEFADMATVNGINALQSQVASIQAGAAAAQLGQAAGMVGKTVALKGDGFIMPHSGAATGAFNLPSAAASAEVKISDASGKQVAIVPLGAVPAGTGTFHWNGGTAGHAYRFSVLAADAAGNAVQATPYATGTVTSVDLSGSTPSLSVSGQSAPTPLSNIQSILGG